MNFSVAARTVATPEPSVFLSAGPYQTVISTESDVMALALSLRATCFRGGQSDQDAFDSQCMHGVALGPNDEVLAAFRVRLVSNPTELDQTYTGQYYDLRPLHVVQKPFLELGRFCLSSTIPDLRILRLAWAAIGVLADKYDVGMIIGCSSFAGTDVKTYDSELTFLKQHHLGPKEMRPIPKSPLAVSLPDGSCGAHRLPHLLRSYLNMGGWVSDHVVKDLTLNTLHVFTGLSIDAIPERRKRRLRAMAQSAYQTS